MKRSIAAVLLSGLVFPGSGHLYLRRYRFGAILVFAALVALGWIVREVWQQALPFVAQIQAGEVPLDPAAIADLVIRSSNDREGASISIAFLVAGVVWLVGVVDSYRIGAQDRDA